MAHYTSGFLSGGGWTDYNRGIDNTFQMWLPNTLVKSVVCLSQVTLELVWERAPSVATAVSFEPNMGPVTGFTSVQVFGFNFDQKEEYTCVFGGVPVPAQFVSSTQLTCESPVWFGGINPVGNGFQKVAMTAQLGDLSIGNFSESFYYYAQPVVTALDPGHGNATGGELVAVVGKGFLSTPEMVCRFGAASPVTATFVSAEKILCHSPAYVMGSDPVVAVEIAENGVDFTDNGVTFSYENVPFLGSWTLWQLIVLIGGCVLIAAILIVIIAVCVYRKARSKDESRRYLDTSDEEEETEPLIASINSKTMRHVLAGVQRVGVDELRIDRRIGRGSFGEVFHAFWGGTEIALKKLPKHMLASAKFLEDFAQEIAIMAKLRHPNVIQFLGVAVDKVSLYMLTEYMPRGSLYDVIHNREQDLPLELIMSLLLDTARGMTYLHSVKVVHRDLKSHNLLVDQHFHIRICDFGLSRLFEETQNTMTACGTPCWTAPEVLRNERYTEKADVYSFAIVVWECLTREDPFAGMPPFHVVFSVGTKGARPDAIYQESPLSDLMKRCWTEEPDERPAFIDIVDEVAKMLAPAAIDQLKPAPEKRSTENNNNNNNVSSSSKDSHSIN